MGMSVCDFMKANSHRPFEMEQTRYIAYQLCRSVQFLHDNKLTHTDLKPENILFLNSDYTTIDMNGGKPYKKIKDATIRVIDLGSATFDHWYHSSEITTSYYRAPEVILELGWSQPCDVWSIGCILFELYKGRVLFETGCNRELLAMMDRVLGPLPSSMVNNTKTKDRYFPNGRLKWDTSTSEGKYRYMSSTDPEHEQLFELIELMLDYEQASRIKLDSAFQHSFFDNLPEYQRRRDGSSPNHQTWENERSLSSPDRAQEWEREREHQKLDGGLNLTPRDESLRRDEQDQMTETETRFSAKENDREERELSNQSSTVIMDDSEGNLLYSLRDVISSHGSKFQILTDLDEGWFGKVVQVKDMSSGKNLAVKITKSTSEHRESALREIDMLEKLKELDVDNKYGVIQLLQHFSYWNHICLVFEQMGMSVFDFMKANSYRPYTMEQTRHIAYQLCHAVKFLHDNKLTHTDIKPENILFVNSDYVTIDMNGREPYKKLKDATIRVINLGAAIFDHWDHSTVITTCHYRAPEAVLELGWEQPCDVWSIGCVLFELYQADLLFYTDTDETFVCENGQLLTMMQHILGPLPIRMVKETKTEYFPNGKLEWDAFSPEARERRDNSRPLREYMTSNDTNHVELFNLIELMLDYEPASRIKLGDALRHCFFDHLSDNRRVPSIHRH